jgi:PmbA protein
MNPATQSPADLLNLATEMVDQAIRAGAHDAEVSVSDGDEFSTTVRMGEVETLKESGSRGIGLRVLLHGDNGYRVASTSSSDFTPSGLDHLVRGAMALAAVTSEDPFAGLPEPGAYGQLAEDLQLYHEDVYSLPTADRIALARRAEEASLKADARLINSDGASFEAATGSTAFANSRGFSGAYRSSYCGISASPIAQGADGQMQRDYWYTNARSLARLESPESVGEEAARRTLRMLDARRVPTQQVPIVFSPEMARGILGSLFNAISGDAIWRSASFLAGKLGQSIAAPNLTLIDDGTLPGGFGSAPFDGEGLATRRNVFVRNGVLESYVLHGYTARKLKMASTASAGRGLAGNPYTRSYNLFIEAGSQTPEEILSSTRTGLYVTRLMGQGVNLVTGDYSRGAAGLWIQDGKLTYPVQEITIAGNLKEMLQNISAIGNDLVFRSSTAAPTLRIEGMTVAGGD